jgi:sugar phosphate isomerase/epimerase
VNCLSINQVSSLKWNFFQDVIRYARKGFNGIGLWRSKVEDIGVQEAADFLYEMKMSVSSLGWVGGFTGSEGVSFKDAVEDAFEGIEAAAQLGASCLILHPGSQGLHTPRHARRLLLNALEILVPCAEAYDVTLAIEPMTANEGHSWTMLSGVMETLDIVENYSSDQVGIVMDLYHLGLEPQLARHRHRLSERLKLIQIADRRRNSMIANGRCLPGSGEVPLRSWIKLMAMSGYHGPIEAEVIGVEVEGLGYECVLDSTWEFLVDCREICRSVGRGKRNSQKPTGQPSQPPHAL